MAYPVIEVRESTVYRRSELYFDALRVMLAWTGWRRVTRFTDYRPGSSEAVFLCEKTDELTADGDLAPVVSPHRRR